MNARPSTPRLFQPEQIEEARPTVRELFEEVVAPALRASGLATSTIGDYGSSVTKWEEFWQSGGPKVPDELSGTQNQAATEPAAADVTRSQLKAFAQWYRGLAKPVTINRRVGLLVAILSAAADDDDCEFVNPPRPPKRMTQVCNTVKMQVPTRHVEAIYEACEVAVWPTHQAEGQPLDASAADYWRCLIVLLFNFGPRLQDVWAYDLKRSPICWDGETSGVVFDRESPRSEAESDHGWLWYTPRKTRRTKPSPLVLPLPYVVRRHLEIIRGNGTGEVFNLPRNRTAFARQRARIFEASGVSPKPALSAGRRHYVPKDLRDNCLSMHQRINRGIGPFITGHDDRSGDRVVIADRHYDNPEYALADHFRRVPQPLAFESFDADKRPF